MAVKRPPFTVGIEEEYLLVDRQTRDLIAKPDPGMWEGLREVLGPQVGPEFLKAQIEVGTKVSKTLADCRHDLARLRRDLSDVVSEYDAAIICTHTGGVTPRTRPYRIDYDDVVASAIADTVAYAERVASTRQGQIAQLLEIISDQ